VAVEQLRGEQQSEGGAVDGVAVRPALGGRDVGEADRRAGRGRGEVDELRDDAGQLAQGVGGERAGRGVGGARRLVDAADGRLRARALGLRQQLGRLDAGRELVLDPDAPDPVIDERGM
jgi:hypothetical protein